MKQKITRRDFLKLLGAASLLAPSSKLFRYSEKHPSKASISVQPNIIILLFDTLSANHMSLYGYERNTTPNIDKFARKSTVFHRNYAPSNFTQPSTASILTGVYPWSHRSLTFFSPLLKKFENNNILSGLTASHQTITYTHNIHAANILEQFGASIDVQKPIQDLVLYDGNKYQHPFKKDTILGPFAAKRWLETFFAPSSSLFLNPVFTIQYGYSIAKLNNMHMDQYPLGLSERDGYLFKLEDAIDWIGQISSSASQPFFGYFHLLPPHEMYKPRADFFGKFTDDGHTLIRKPEHHFTENISPEQQSQNCQLYDEYIALVDAEFGRLIQLLEEQGVLDNTYLILTSDHGQILERGIHGHSNPVLYESVIHVPLIIHEPGQVAGKDIYTLTNLIDIVPTLLALMGQKPLINSEGYEGKLLPTLGGAEDQNRIIFSMYAQQNAVLSPLTNVTYSAIQWPYKLINYRGYSDYNDVDELYNLQEDPNELNNIAKNYKSVVKMLKEELLIHQSTAEKKSLSNNQRHLNP